MFYIVYARRDLGKLDFSIVAKANDLSETIASCYEMPDNILYLNEISFTSIVSRVCVGRLI